MVKVEIVDEGRDRILRIYAEDIPELATLEDSPTIMATSIKYIHDDPRITTIEILQEEVISYYFDTISYLKEFGDIYYSIKNELKNYYHTVLAPSPIHPEISRIFQYIDRDFIYDPVGTYINVKRLYRKLLLISEKNDKVKSDLQKLYPLLKTFFDRFERTNAYIIIKNFLSGYDPRTRSIYKRLFIPDIRPKFVTLKYISKIPDKARVIESYMLDKNTEVIIFKLPNEEIYRYYIFPEEYKLFERELFILGKARDVMIQYQPRKEDYLDPERLKDIYTKIADNIIESLSRAYNVVLSKSKKEQIKSILIRYTIGFGILEKLAKDERIQDIYINPPEGLVPVAVQHADYDLCVTNIIPTKRELESWATKLRLISGRPFDEANPVLDTEIFVNDIRLRLAAIMRPLSPHGLSFVLRRHRTRPWTLPLFIKNKMLSPLAAGLLSFLVEYGRTILIAGTRSAGKTSLLTSLMLEIPRSTRIITIEDTMEIPVDYFRKLKYNIVPMKVRSPLSIQSSELTAEDGVRVSLRLGDSAIILGEVRSKEAKTLYEAMRVGALANAVMGTIHAESPYGVFDRVVNDLGVPRTSFKATDLIVIANPIRDPVGVRKYRRVIRLTEVRKHWEEDPLRERGFVDLMIYDADKDTLNPTKDLINGNSDILKSVAARIRKLAGSWEKLWSMIEIKGESKKMLVELSIKYNKPDILEADFVVLSNSVLSSIIDEVYNEIGDIDKQYILDKYKKWLITTISR